MINYSLTHKICPEFPVQILCLQISIKDNIHGTEQYPGQDYAIQVMGEKGTRVGLLGVDQSVYLLRNKNRLTPESVS